ncbi:extracellular solute-binding protein [Propioniciclava coleopterorum]|uniref:Extracellular solute-binding protein n=1 Tax=Propioniciclava coleopterorum TaxID=2714937 RepID=A0A6G7Y4I4_9ACTN|nr:extracellular solute-binding protein [Propioniciclava coleopterorum]QIK71527.1 extracellular solute-binding protein [Propioniciclava coleopterorum]
MLTRRTLLLSAGSAALLAPLAACGGSAAPQAPATALPTDATATITMTWWGNDDRANKYKEAIAAFNKKYPKISVQAQFQPFADYWTARNTEAAGGALPDVMQMDISYLRQFANNGQLLDLNSQAGTNLDVTGLDAAILGSGKLEDKLYGVATSTNTLAMFYHPGILDKLGASAPKDGYTWDDYKKSVIDASAAGAKFDPKLYYGGNPGGVLWFFIQWLLQKGVTPFKDDNTLGFGKDEVREWLTMWEPLNATDVKFPSARTEQLKPKGGFTANEVALEASWDNFLSGYVKDSGDDAIKMMPIPSGADGKTHMFYKPSMLLSAGANTKNPDAAAALISFMINDPEVGKIFGTSKGVPATKAQRDAMDIAPGSVDQRVVAYEESVASQVTEASPVPVEGFGAIEAAWLRLAGDYGYDKLTVDQWIDQWFQSVDENVKPA